MNIRPCSPNSARFTTFASAVALGTFGWLLAHALTYWIVAHGHPDALGRTDRHVHAYSMSMAVPAGWLGAVLLIAVLVIGVSQGARRYCGAGERPHWGRVVGRSTGLSVAAFAAAEVTQHLAMGDQHSPSGAALVVGLILHALIGAMTSIFWLRYTANVSSLRVPSDRFALSMPARVVGRLSSRRRRHDDTMLAFCVIGRAPPAWSFA